MPTALVDTRHSLLMPTALSPDMKRLMERAVAADMDGEILSVHHEHATLPRPCHVLRIRCPETQKEPLDGDGW